MWRATPKPDGVATASSILIIEFTVALTSSFV